MTAIRSTADPLAKCRGQAMVETAIGLVLFVFVTAALVSFATLFLEDIDMIADARAETGVVARNSTAGEAHGNGFGISSKAHPKIVDYGEEPRSAVASDPYSYPCQLAQQAGNDALAQLNCNMEEFEGLQLPKPQMQIAKDWSKRTATFTDMTENGEALY